MESTTDEILNDLRIISMSPEDRSSYIEVWVKFSIASHRGLYGKRGRAFAAGTLQ